LLVDRTRGVRNAIAAAEALDAWERERPKGPSRELASLEDLNGK
jgi:hypothetical protein